MSTEPTPTVEELLLCFCSYYLDVLHQDYGGPGSFKIAVFKGESPYTDTQTDDARNEQQNIIADYDVFDEAQVRNQPAY